MWKNKNVGFLQGVVVQMPCKHFHGVELFRSFMKLINNIRKKATAVSEHIISHVSGEFLFRFGKVSGDFT